MSKRSIIATNVPKGIWPFTLGSIIYEPIAVIIIAGIAYAAGILLDARWVSVPLSATIVTTAVLPASEEAAFTRTLSGNIIAILVAFVIIRTFGLEHYPGSDFLAAFGPQRALGVLIALIVTPTICSLARILQPSAAATAAFIVFCGITPTQHSATALMAEVLLVSVVGDVMRRWRVKGAPVR